MPQDSSALTTCASLLRELQLIWDEVGESDQKREEMLQELEEECLQVYRRKVKQASDARASLQKKLEDYESEVSSLIARLEGCAVSSSEVKVDKPSGTLKEQLDAIQPHLDDLRCQQEDRVQQFLEVKELIQRITGEIAGEDHTEVTITSVSEEHDLSLRKLEEYNSELQTLKTEKSIRLQKVSEYVNVVHELCAVLGMDFFKTITEVHSSLGDSLPGSSRSISNGTLDKLANMVNALQKEKKSRIQKLQSLGASLIELWNLMDTPMDEQYAFDHVTCIISMTEEEVSTPGALALDNIEQAEVEVERLDNLKASRTKELVLKKQEELDEIYQAAHMEPDPDDGREKIMSIIDSGCFDPSEILASMDKLINKAKENAYSRKEILEKVEKWMTACEEESWLEDYSRDQNRYNASRGAHLNLKRAERARVTVNRLPALVDTLVAKTRAWEEEHGIPFVYDGVQLLVMLDEYTFLRQEKEEEKRRARDQKKQQETMAEQETVFGPRASPSKPTSIKKSQSARTNGDVQPNRRLTMPQSTYNDMLIPRMNGLTPIRVGKDVKKERPIGAVSETAPIAG